MGIWNPGGGDVVRARYAISVQFGALDTANIRIILTSTAASGDIPQADAKEMLDAVLAALATNPLFTVRAVEREYTTRDSYTP